MPVDRPRFATGSLDKPGSFEATRPPSTIRRLTVPTSHQSTSIPFVHCPDVHLSDTGTHESMGERNPTRLNLKYTKAAEFKLRSKRRGESRLRENRRPHLAKNRDSAGSAAPHDYSIPQYRNFRSFPSASSYSNNVASESSAATGESINNDESDGFNAPKIFHSKSCWLDLGIHRE